MGELVKLIKDAVKSYTTYVKCKTRGHKWITQKILEVINHTNNT